MSRSPPCVVGYGEIGRMLGTLETVANNPYRAWIEMYSGDEYQAVARGAVAALDDLWTRRGSEARLAGAQKVFDEATRLEAGFWQMGLDAA